jgi:hypothetical protein
VTDPRIVSSRGNIYKRILFNKFSIYKIILYIYIFFWKTFKDIYSNFFLSHVKRRVRRICRCKHNLLIGSSLYIHKYSNFDTLSIYLKK